MRLPLAWATHVWLEEDGDELDDPTPTKRAAHLQAVANDLWHVRVPVGQELTAMGRNRV